jgi:hypothetical protein
VNFSLCQAVARSGVSRVREYSVRWRGAHHLVPRPHAGGLLRAHRRGLDEAAPVPQDRHGQVSKSMHDCVRIRECVRHVPNEYKDMISAISVRLLFALKRKNF